MKILIVDDEPFIQEMLVLALGPYGISHVTADGQEAVAAVERALDEKTPYQLVCLDLNMLKPDSFQTLVEIRSLEEARDIRPVDRVKVLIISGSDDPHDIARAFREGNCDGYLTKPFDKRDFWGQLEKIGLAPPEEEEEIFDND
jgi:two-component system chemotaxis response regulator CheY